MNVLKKYKINKPLTHCAAMKSYVNVIKPNVIPFLAQVLIQST